MLWSAGSPVLYEWTVLPVLRRKTEKPGPPECITLSKCLQSHHDMHHARQQRPSKVELLLLLLPLVLLLLLLGVVGVVRIQDQKTFSVGINLVFSSPSALCSL